MSKPYTDYDLSAILDSDLSWRRKELSDLKAAIKSADRYSKSSLTKAIIAMCYAHWEGYVRVCANRYFEHLTLKRRAYNYFERQVYVNAFLVRLDALKYSRTSLEEKCRLINEILDSRNNRFSYINSDLVDTKSNLNTSVVKEICIICGVDFSHFESKQTFIDVILLKRRNAIAHGQYEAIDISEVDDIVAEVLALMEHFRTLLENKVYSLTYAA